jgi:hypothetical protein
MRPSFKCNKGDQNPDIVNTCNKPWLKVNTTNNVRFRSIIKKKDCHLNSIEAKRITN